MVIRKWELKREAGGKVSPGCAGRFCPPPLSIFSPSPQHITQLCSPTFVASGLSCNSPLSLFHPLSLSFFLCLYVLFTCFHSYMQQQRLGCFLRDGRWTNTWTGCKDLPNQGLFDLLLYVQSECMFSRCGSLRPRVSGRRILLVSARGNTSLIISA